MSAQEVLERIRDIRIIPVVVIDDPGLAPDLAAALTAGGIPCAEITLRTPAGLAAIAAIDAEGFTLGAGTVTSPNDVDKCADAGAEFIVSPGLDAAIVERAHYHGLAVLPGVATATEIQQAARLDLRVVKFFPADRLGGLGTIAALAAPFPDVRFVPSGGVGPSNLAEYLAHPAVFAASGSWMVSRHLLAAHDLDSITRLSAEASR